VTLIVIGVSIQLQIEAKWLGTEMVLIVVPKLVLSDVVSLVE